VTIRFWIEWAVARLALVDGRPQDTVATLQAIQPTRDRVRWSAQNMVLADADLGDALALTGDEAGVRSWPIASVASRRRRQAPDRGGRAPRGPRRPDDGFEGRFAASLAAHAEVAAPFERGGRSCPWASSGAGGAPAMPWSRFATR
jgi:hypothetical protein